MPETHRLCDKSAELSSLIKRVAAARRFVVITGAGISVNCGIPDFRSSQGIFQQIQKAHGDLISSGRDLFDASVVFRSSETANIFYHWMTHLRHQCAKAQPGATHQFIRTLADRGLLLRSYTQNIDGLERKAGLNVWDPYMKKGNDEYVPWQAAQSIPLHGSMDHLVCQLCSSSYAFSECPAEDGDAARSAGDACPDCFERSETRRALGRRQLPAGKLRPTVVLYEEPHPHCEDIGRIISHDARTLGSRQPRSESTGRVAPTNVVLIFGTTLKVPGCRQLVKQMAMAAPASTVTVLVNNEPVCGKSWDGIIDYQVIGNVEDWCARVERIWNAQTKITRWAKTRKHTVDDGFEGSVKKGSSEPAPAGKRRKPAAPVDVPAEGPIEVLVETAAEAPVAVANTTPKEEKSNDDQMDSFIDIITVEDDIKSMAKSVQRAGKSTKAASRLCDEPLARRSMRIAQKQSLEDTNNSASSQNTSITTAPICT
ncbi:NAD-dependent deacetylase hst3 [Kickxella alabastrina]|uniref:NAD-dependent deacetylase hst3 n=1 Tax=Kickxella alabastrina TaxID=61397 RepID=A0ACC1IIM7_9FUNG|nr:NAD-dependent deacetylase hst3 [Kickxella alabastrina]